MAKNSPPNPLFVDGLEGGGLNFEGVRGGLTSAGLQPIDAIPDTSMFQDPLYQFWAGGYEGSDGDSPVSFPEVLAGLSNASANGDPTFDTDLNGEPAISYDGSDDSHNWTPNADMPSGSDNYSVACLFYLNSANQSGNQSIFGWGDSGGANYLGTDASSLSIYHPDVLNPVAGTLNDGYNTAGFSYSDASLDAYLNGSKVVDNDAANSSVANNNHSIGFRGRVADLYFAGGLVEAIVTTANESDAAYSEYHNHRLG